MFTRALIFGLLATSASGFFSQKSFAQNAVEYEVIDVSVQSCLDSWAKEGASELSRKACLYALVTPTVKHQYALLERGTDNKFTQYAAHASMQASYYVTESYIDQMDLDNPSEKWVATMCKYNAEVIRFARTPFNLLQPQKVKFAKEIEPRLIQIDQACRSE